MAILNPKYPIDKLVNINKESWRILSYRNKYGHTPTYTLKHESDGTTKYIDLEENSLKEIIRSGSVHDENTI